MLRTAALLSTALVASCASVPRSPDGEKAITFTSESGDEVAAFEGTFTVPENRDDPESRPLTLTYLRFPATEEKNGPPIVYLAGGPGGSGIDAAGGRRFPLFMAMREFGDVIAFDQRGTGKSSNDLPLCRSSQSISTTTATSDTEVVEIQRRAFSECLGFWKEEGVDVAGWNTEENAQDLSDLRRHLGARKISLWGISYGSHLALAALKGMDREINRVVITAIEGLDQTVKLPARSDAYFDRLQAAIDTVPEARAKYPDVKGLMRRVLDRLDAEPLLLEIPSRSGGTNPYLLQKRDMQQFTGGLAADPARVVLLLRMYEELDAGRTDFIARILSSAVDPTDTTVSYPAMSILMDVASGSSPQRSALIEEQAATAIVGPHLNFSMHLETVDPSLDLGEGFRAAPVSWVPTLVLSGTLDGRTFPESGLEATRGLQRAQRVTVTNGGHNLFMLSPEVTETIADFMRGEDVDGRNIIVDLPDF